MLNHNVFTACRNGSLVNIISLQPCFIDGNVTQVALHWENPESCYPRELYLTIIQECSVVDIISLPILGRQITLNLTGYDQNGEIIFLIQGQGYCSQNNILSSLFSACHVINVTEDVIHSSKSVASQTLLNNIL